MRSSCGVLDSSSYSIDCSSWKHSLIVLSKDLTRSSSEKDLNECSPRRKNLLIKIKILFFTNRELDLIQYH
jgi:hypothetical protein